MSGHRKQDERDDALSRDVYETLKADGRIVPQTEADVADAEAIMSETSAELPPELRDVKTVFQGPAADSGPKVIGLPGETEDDAPLRRAAREGGHLSPEIEDRMRQDRLKAQQDQGDDHGQDSR